MTKDVKQYPIEDDPMCDDCGYSFDESCTEKDCDWWQDNHKE